MDTKRVSSLDLSALAAAPHRLLFFIGAANVLAAMAWWTGWLGGWLPTPSVPAGWMHAFVMQYQVLPTFIFGFLLTVYPRWMALEEATRWHYLPVGLGLLSGQALTLVAAWSGSALALHLGWINTLAGWLAGMAVLAGWLRQARAPDWHARSAFAALLVGLAGVLLFGAWLHGGSIRALQVMAMIATPGLLVPIYLTVAHRVFPFFAGNVVAHYVPWRPRWVLGALWAGTLAHLAFALADLAAWRWIADLGLFALGVVVLWRWWPRGRAPALLRVLFIGLLWWPVGMAMHAVDSLAVLLGDGAILGRAPLHALAVGFFGSLLVAMVTRVTAGHSGRPLVLGRLAAVAFCGLQGVAVLRILADLAPDPRPYWLASAIGWLLVFAPWALRHAWIYLLPRADGKAG